ncbi:MAG: histidine kinase dimerization/phospho-acceptor domain-containing protein [Bdellovibrionia bacterium]
MQTLKSSFLLVGPWPQELKEIGAEIVKDLGETRRYFKSQDFHVLGLSLTAALEKKFEEIYQKLKETTPSTQIVLLVPTDYQLEKILDLHTKFQFCKVIQGFQDPQLESHLYSALEVSHQKQQDEFLVKLIDEQKQKLLNLQSELEQRVEKRTKYLTESRRKLFITNTRIEGFKKALMSVHQATTLPDIERLLSDSLAPSVDTSWIRIFFSPHDELFKNQVEQKLDFTIQQISLHNSHQQIGSIFFMRAPNKPFLKEEIDFLNRVAEAVSLSLDRITKLREIENVKEHWENTFNALSEPVILTDKDYNVIQANTAAVKKTSSKDKTSDLSQKCYQLLFNRESPCTNCNRGQNYQIKESQDGKTLTHEVTSQDLQMDHGTNPVFVNFYRDVTEKLKLEKQILDSARLAEMGTIGSSIAHELNNPLGGILTFAQLLKMELPPTHRFYEDVSQIEMGAQRCKEIIQNLLGFTRSPKSDEVTVFKLEEALQRALKILELQTKSKGIQIQFEHQVHQDSEIQGHINLVSQALKNIVQLALDNFRNLKNHNAEKINIVLRASQEEIVLEVHNHLPYSSNPNIHAELALPIANQILRDHNARLDFRPDANSNWMAKISFSRPVLRP